MVKMSVGGSLRAGRDWVPGQPQVHGRYLSSGGEARTDHLGNCTGGVWHTYDEAPSAKYAVNMFRCNRQGMFGWDAPTAMQ